VGSAEVHLDFAQRGDPGGVEVPYLDDSRPAVDEAECDVSLASGWRRLGGKRCRCVQEDSQNERAVHLGLLVVCGVEVDLLNVGR
jgi:hypothetical protein